MQATPLAWVAAIRACRLYGYRFDATPFTPWADAEGQWVTREPVVSTSVEPVGDLVDRHAQAGVELRFVPDLEPLRSVVVSSGLPFSIVRFDISSR